jgi:hypothetical protein
MADVLRIRLDLDLISRHFTASGEPTDVAGVVAWLLEQQLIRAGEHWICEDIQLGLFGDGEVLDVVAV